MSITFCFIKTKYLFKFLSTKLILVLLLILDTDMILTFSYHQLEVLDLVPWGHILEYVPLKFRAHLCFYKSSCMRLYISDQMRVNIDHTLLFSSVIVSYIKNTTSSYPPASIEGFLI